MTQIAVTIVLALLIFGVNNVMWASVGCVRWLTEALARGGNRTGAAPAVSATPAPAQVAVLMAAHNEEAVIVAAIASAATLVPASQIFIASDGSTDKTVCLARAAGATVLDLQPNRGKAGALAAGVETFSLPDRFEVVLILDADTELDSDYLRTGLPLFSDPRVAVVAGRATTQWHFAGLTMVGRILLLHRERVYAVVQRLIKYGQGFRSADAISIAPGFASMYRTSVLRHIEMNPPGLIIEDFNMTFEIHRHRLGRIAFHPGAAVARTQDPVALREYRKQVRRWSLGFWQTIRLHGLRHAGVFWLGLILYCAELVVSAVALILTAAVVIVAVTLSAASWALSPVLPEFDVTAALPPWLPGVPLLVAAVLIPDLLLTIAVAAGQRRGGFLLASPAFPLMRLVDAWICLATLAASFSATSSGRWSSPTRRPATAAPVSPTSIL